MLISAETLQRLIDYQVAKDRRNETITRARNAGDEHAVWFYSLPEQTQQNLLAQQDIADAVEAANAGDVAGLRQGITSAVNRAVYGGAQLVKPQRIVPRRRSRR
jgi:hypothetical protein